MKKLLFLMFYFILFLPCNTCAQVQTSTAQASFLEKHMVSFKQHLTQFQRQWQLFHRCLQRKCSEKQKLRQQARVLIKTLIITSFTIILLLKAYRYVRKRRKRLHIIV